MVNEWTQAEKKLLRKLYPRTSNVDIGQKLGRTREAVKYKAHMLGLKKARGYFFWTDRDIKLLKRQFGNTSIRVDDIAERLDRGIKAVRNKAIELGLKRRKPAK